MNESNELEVGEQPESRKEGEEREAKTESGTGAVMDVQSEESEQESSEESTEEESPDESLEESSEDSYSEESDHSSDEEPLIYFLKRPESPDKHSKESSEDSDSMDEGLEADTKYSAVCQAAAESHAESSFAKHLMESINRPECSDVEFICKDGDKVYASKILCMGRSEMLDAMFQCGMLESRSCVVRVPEVCSRTLLPILEVLYLGRIDRYRPTDWKMGFEILEAAHFFMLWYMDKIVEKHLLQHVKRIRGNLQQAAEMLNLAMEYKFLHEGGKYVSLQRLVHLLREKWMHKDCVFHLTEQAVDYLLKQTRSMEVTGRVWLDEYLRFRGALMWAICIVVSGDEAEEIFDLVIPAALGKVRVRGTGNCGQKKWTWLPGYKVSRTNNKIMEILDAHQVCKEAATRLLQANIDWMRIPQKLFLSIVEPLKIVPDSQLLDIFRSHLMQCE